MKIAMESGKRKMATARARVRDGKGRVRINSLPLEFHEPKMARDKMIEAVKVAGDIVNKLDIDVNVSGGGVIGQAEASRTAIAKAIVAYTGNAELKKKYIAYDRTLIVSDVRRKLPKKPLGRGARKKRQKSYR